MAGELFSSWQFIFLFLPAVAVIFAIVPAQPLWPRKAWLLAASLFFYSYWKIEYVPLLLFSICFNYRIAEIIARRGEDRARKMACLCGVAANLLLLGYYKYTNFLAGILGHFFGGTALQQPVHFDIVLPLAISFFTFTQIAYLVDVYRDPSLHHRFLDYALFVAFFPHLIAGPIVRHWEIIPQFSKRPLRPDVTDRSLGLALFVMGLSKKVLLADPLSQYVSAVYGAAAQGTVVTWFDAWLGTISFALQIYFDFSGYSDMAIGLARLFGIKFPVNFNSPYQAGSISEFWSRWHITLTRFLREYIYFPLGGNRFGFARQAFNIMATMLLSGLWRGAGWTYVFWGGLHGVYLVVSHRWRKFKETRWKADGFCYRFSARCVTLLAVLVAWVFFRAATFSAALNLLSGMFGGHGWTMTTDVTNPAAFPGRLWAQWGVLFVPGSFKVESYDWLFQVIAVAALIAVFFPNSQQLLADYQPALESVRRPRFVHLRLSWSGGVVLGVIFWGIIRSFYSATPSPFLHFNF
jgi:D-alanyl-lipoteichoic acid acyltransferase DltB (MBOAT superfamily)